MKKFLILLSILISTTIVIGSEKADDLLSDKMQYPEELDKVNEDEKQLVKRQAYRRPTVIFDLFSSFLQQPSYNYQQNYNQQRQFYRPQQTFLQSPQFGGHQTNNYNQQRPQYNNYQQNQYQPFNFIDHLNKLPRNSETFGYYLDPYHGRRLPENERHLWGPSESYRESLRGRRAIFYYRGYQHFVSKIAFNPHRGVKMYVVNVGNIPGI
ncbi:unnamed protein product [Chironomus riparius]|uniref:Uncharacterized protein n=1 Tax=Chironomus riparius TaxID=315576 RepID=A0A9N9RQI9_9DIPT|nr:unnamed protein product [Chironomus riparius]